jgi:hypothetical protein
MKQPIRVYPAARRAELPSAAVSAVQAAFRNSHKRSESGREKLTGEGSRARGSRLPTPHQRFLSVV